MSEMKKMTEEQSFEMIKAALDETGPDLSKGLTMDTDLSGDDVLDSLDRMTFLFELENLNGSKIEQITDTFEDFRIKTLVSFLTTD